MIDKLLEKLAGFEQVEAIALGGSRSGENYDEKSDYDLYVYVTAPIGEENRRALLADYCKYLEIGNHYWEYEDNCVLNNGIDIDILYRDLNEFCDGVARVVESFEACNGYTTCMWHNLLWRSTGKRCLKATAMKWWQIMCSNLPVIPRHLREFLQW